MIIGHISICLLEASWLFCISTKLDTPLELLPTSPNIKNKFNIKTCIPTLAMAIAVELSLKVQWLSLWEGNLNTSIVSLADNHRSSKIHNISKPFTTDSGILSDYSLVNFVRIVAHFARGEEVVDKAKQWSSYEVLIIDICWTNPKFEQNLSLPKQVLFQYVSSCKSARLQHCNFANRDTCNCDIHVSL